MDLEQLPQTGDAAVAEMSDASSHPSELNATPEQEPDGQVIDQAEWDAIRARAAAADAYEQQLAAANAQQKRYEQQLAQHAVYAWQQAEQDMKRQVQGLDYEQGLRVQEQFYKGQNQFLLQQAQVQQQQMHQERLHAWVTENIREQGLSEHDRQQLFQVAMQNPDMVPGAARYLKQQGATDGGELARVRAENEQLKRAQAANAMRQSGAWQAGGTQPQPVNTKVEPGSVEGFAQALAGTAGFR